MKSVQSHLYEENGPADPALQALSLSWRRLLAKSGLDRAGDGLQWLLITYAHTYDSDPKQYWAEEGCQ
jgi:hypothetical protein